MNLFYQAFNTRTLSAIGIKLPPYEQRELIERLADTLRQRLRKIAEDRLGRSMDELEATGAAQYLIRAHFPDYQGVMQVECMRLFQEVEEHASEIMGGEWEVAA